MEEKKVIIIGAGPAGLTAAYKLLTETDYKPVILEESPYIGGISRTAVHNGNRMDLGGHRFFSKDDSVMKLWFDLMPLQGAPAKDDIILSRPVPLAEGGPDPESEERVMLVRDRVSRIYFLKKFFDYPVTLSGATLKNMGFKNTMRVGFGYMASVFHKLPEDSLENLYQSLRTPALRDVFRGLYDKALGREPEEHFRRLGRAAREGAFAFQSAVVVHKQAL